MNSSAFRKLLAEYPHEAEKILNLKEGRLFRSDPARFMGDNLWIGTKAQQVIRLNLNDAQAELNRVVEEQRKETGRVRIVILKARQQGISTYIAGRISATSVTRNNSNSLIVAHELDAAQNLFGMHQLFYDRLPNHLRIPTQYSNRKEFVFKKPEWKWQSRVIVDTASNTEAGRSFTIHNLHCSEVAFYKDADRLMLGLMQAVPDHPDTSIFLESTANGVGGWFYNKYQEAKQGRGSFRAIFIPWFVSAEYRIPCPEPLQLTKEEEELKAAYGLEDEQLAWRRYAIVEKCNGSIEQFRQEYPANDSECFQSSGRSFFDLASLNLYQQRVVRGERGELDRDLVFVPNRRAPLEVWEHPDPDHVYVIGADVAEGLQHGDFSSATVIDRNTHEVVASYHGRVAPDVFASDLDLLGRYYNVALLAVESNNHGLATLTELRRHKRYPWLFVRWQIDRRSNQKMEHLGWRTDRKSKPLMLDQLSKAVRLGEVGLKDGDLLEEMRSFIVWPNGDLGAEEGCFDDRVISAAIAWHVCFHAATKPQKQEQVIPGSLNEWIKELDQEERSRRRLRFRTRAFR